MMSRRIAFFLLLLTSFFGLRAQQFTAEIEPVGAYYRLTFTVRSTDVSNFTPPSLSAFEVRSGLKVNTYSSTHITLNGMRAQKQQDAGTTFTYILQAKQSGQTTIGPASVQVGGRTLRSKPLTVKLYASGGGSGGASHSQQGQSAPSGGAEEIQKAGSPVTERDLFVDVTPSRTRVKEQEAVLLTYRIHARAGVGLSNTQLTTKPDFKGLISHEIPLPGNQIQTTMEQRGGTAYRTGVILQYLIFPQQAGKLTIPSITFDCTIVQQDRSMDMFDLFFNGGGTVGLQVQRKVPELHLDVEALPTPKPAAFTGAVGHFKVNGALQGNTPRTGDVATYRISVTGEGNLALITPPVVAFPSDFETYEAKTTDQTKTTTDGLKGTLHFDYTFVPRNVGDYEIPAVEFVYFNPETNAYETLRTAPVKLHVEKGERSNSDVDRQLALLRSDIRPVHTESNSGNWHLLPQWGTWGFRLVQLLLLVAFAVALYFLRRISALRGDTRRGRRSRALRVALASLAEAQKLLATDHAKAYTALHAALVQYLCDKLSLEKIDIQRETLPEKLGAHGVGEPEQQKLVQLLDECQLAAYASVEAGKDAATFSEAQALLDTLEKQMKTSNPKKNTTMRTLLLALLAFSMTTAFAQPSRQEADKAMASKNYVGAVAAYTKCLQEMQNDKAADDELRADVYYNLGCARYRLKQYGPAVLNFQRALYLHPAHEDAAFNLELTQLKLTDRFDAPDEFFFVSWAKQLVYGRSSTTWGYCSLAALLLTLLSLLALWTTKRLWQKRLVLTLAVLFGLGTVLAEIFAALQTAHLQADAAAVVMQTTAAQTSPSATAKPLRTLHEGTTVRILETYPSGWLQVELPDGSLAYLMASSIEKVF